MRSNPANVSTKSLKSKSMGKPTGFLEKSRELPKKRPVDERVKDYKEFEPLPAAPLLKEQSARCMDCGVPFCHSGCPLGNIIPEFNDACYEENWGLATDILTSTNNFPEFTGRICPAPCEASCVLGINQPPVAIEFIEKNIAEKAFELGLMKPRTPKSRTGKKVAVVGAGPAGMAAADQLNSAGHSVTLFERHEKIGGLLRFGIPDFKLEKWVVERREALMVEAGVEIRTNTNVGVDISVKDLMDGFDAVVLTGGSTIPRDLPIPGREFKGVHFAMDFLTQQNRRVSGLPVNTEEIWATDKRVLVIGGGDTGSDCVGTSNRHGAKSVMQIELLERPPAERSEQTPWPLWPMMLRTSSSHEEGVNRQWALYTKNFIGDEKGNLKGVVLAEMGWSEPDPGKKPKWEIKEGTEQTIECDLALLAIGFVHPQHEGLVDDLKVEKDERGNVKADGYATSVPKVFAAGDLRRGQSLVVWAIAEGRECAREVDQFLMGHSQLEARDVSQLQLQA